MPETPLTFAEVLVEELARIKLRRNKIFHRAQLDDDGEGRAVGRRPTEQARAVLASDPTEALAVERKKIRQYLDEEIRNRQPQIPGPVVAGQAGGQGGALAANQDEFLAAARVVVLKENLAGLAFSGGGIRSATFAVGVLQGLAGLKLLRFFDVLSTVSGGGYAGAWLAAWMRREGDPLNVELQLDVSRTRQARAIRSAGNRVGEKVPRIVDEEFHALLDRSAALITRAAPGSAGGPMGQRIAEVFQDIRAQIVRGVGGRIEAKTVQTALDIIAGVRAELAGQRDEVKSRNPAGARVAAEIDVLSLDDTERAAFRQTATRIVDGTFGTDWAATCARIDKRLLQLFRIGDAVARIVDDELGSLHSRLTGVVLREMAERDQDQVRKGVAGDLRELRAPIARAVSAYVDEALAKTHDQVFTLTVVMPLRVRQEILDRVGLEEAGDRDSIKRLIEARLNEGLAGLNDAIRREIHGRVLGALDESLSAIKGRVGALLDSCPARPTRHEISGRVPEVVDEEPEPIRHLRRYSSYLNPRPGLFSTDTWTLVAIYTRNVLINFLLLLPLVLFAVMTVRGLVLGYDHFAEHPLVQYRPFGVRLPVHAGLVLGLGFALGLVALGINGCALWRLRVPKRGRHGTSWNWSMGGLLLTGVVLVMMAYAQFLRATGAWLAARFGWPAIRNTEYLGLFNILGHMAAIGGLMLILSLGFTAFGALGGRGAAKPAPREHRGRLVPGALLAGMTAGVLIAVVEWLLRPTIDQGMPWLRALAGPPLLLGVIVVGVAALVALVGPAGTEGEREWWGRFSATLMLLAVRWLVVVGVIVYGPGVLLGSHQLVAAALASGWVATTIAGVLAGKSGATTGAGGDRRLELIALVAPPVFLVGVLAVVSTLATLLLNEADDVAAISVQTTFGRALAVYLRTLKATHGHVVLEWWLGCLIVAGLAGYLVNVNLFSLNAMYANRLTRAFLGASRRNGEWRSRWDRGRRDQRALAGAPTGAVGPARDPNPVTGFDPEDDLDLFRLQIGEGDAEARYWGPHVVFNTALNLVGGDELAWRDRKAESFILTPLHCGARSTGYARTTKRPPLRLSVGRAISISGAAVDPNMNFHQSPAVTALLTVFNARLGVWIQNPNPDTWWRRAWKRSGAWQAEPATYGGLLVKELTGQTDEKKEFVHISDGGHFDNLGVYELVKRRCRYIVAVDATENPLATSDNLGILVRLCRVDLGLRLELDTAPLRVVEPDGISRAHAVVGRIRYDDVDNGQTPGLLIYIKSTMTGDEPPDVQQYANLHPEFPRQLTLTDQSFDEDQFESYRTLGAHVARNIFEVAAHSIFRDSNGDGEVWWRDPKWNVERPRAASVAFSQGHRKIFGALRNRWSEPPPREDVRILDSIKSWRTLQHDLRHEPALGGLDREFYPELSILDDPEQGAVRRAELHVLEQTLQFIEEGWIGLGMKGNDEAPISRAWLNAFRRLTGGERFRLFWPLLRPGCSPEFVRFCECRLRLDVAPPKLKEIGWSDPAVAKLGAELAHEWPEHLGRPDPSEVTDPGRRESLAEAGRRYLWDRINRATLGPYGGRDAMRTAWLISASPIGFDPVRDRGFEFPLGIVAVFPPVPVPKRRPEPRGSRPLYELLVWVRPAHRSAGVGEQLLRGAEIADNLIKRLEAEGASMLVRYPEIAGTSDEDQDRVRWLAFYSLFGFAPDPSDPLLPNQTWTLYKDYDMPAPNPAPARGGRRGTGTGTTSCTPDDRGPRS